MTLLAGMAMPAEAKSVIGTVPIPSTSAQFLTVDPDRDRLYASGGASFSPEQTTTIIDSGSGSVIRIVPGSGADFDQDFLYAAQLSPARLLIYTAASSVPAHSVPVNGCPFQSAVDPVLQRVYTVAQCGDGNDRITVTKTDTRTVVGEVATGGVNGAAIVNPITHLVYVTASGLVRKIDPNTLQVSNTTMFGRVAAIDPTGIRLYVDTGRETQVIEAATERVVAVLSASGDVALDGSRKRVYIASAATGSIDVFDSATNAFIDRLAMPLGTSPGEIAIHSDRNRLYVLAQAASAASVVIFDLNATPSRGRAVRSRGAEALSRIDSLSASTGTPGELLTLGVSAVRPAMSISVRFTDQTGTVIELPALSASADLSTVETGVPLFVNRESGLPQSGPIRLQLVQRSGMSTIVSNEVAFELLPPKNSPYPVGAVTAAVLRDSLQLGNDAVAHVGVIDEVAGGSATNSAALTERLRSTVSALHVLAEDIERLRNGERESIVVGTSPDGTVVTLTREGLALLDRLLMPLVLPGPATTATASRPAASQCTPTAGPTDVCTILKELRAEAAYVATILKGYLAAGALIAAFLNTPVIVTGTLIALPVVVAVVPHAIVEAEFASVIHGPTQIEKKYRAELPDFYANMAAEAVSQSFKGPDGRPRPDARWADAMLKVAGGLGNLADVFAVYVARLERLSEEELRIIRESRIIGTVVLTATAGSAVAGESITVKPRFLDAKGATICEGDACSTTPGFLCDGSVHANCVALDTAGFFSLPLTFGPLSFSETLQSRFVATYRCGGFGYAGAPAGLHEVSYSAVKNAINRAVQPLSSGPLFLSCKHDRNPSGAHYTFESGSATLVRDESGAGYDATIRGGAIYTDGVSGRGLRLTQHCQRLVLPPALMEAISTGGGTLYFEASVKIQQETRLGLDVPILEYSGERDPSPNRWVHWGFDLAQRDGTLSLEGELSYGTSPNRIASVGYGEAAVGLGTWVKVAFWYDGSLIRIFINDQDVTRLDKGKRNSIPLQLPSIDWEAVVGGDAFCANVEHQLIGVIDEIRISSKRPD